MEEFPKFFLLLLEPLQRLSAIFVECGIAARSTPAAPPVFPPALHPFILAMPASMSTATHASAPYQVSQQCQADRPGDDESQYQQADPRRLAHLVHSSSKAHRYPLALCEC